MYGLETINLLPSHEEDIDSVFYKGLRKILHKQSTFIDKENTNKKLLEEANTHRKQGSNEYRPPSEQIQKQRMKLLAHIIRSPQNDIMRQPTLEYSNRPVLAQVRREGRPRHRWANEAMKEAYDKIAEKHRLPERNKRENHIKDRQITEVVNIAMQRREWKNIVVYTDRDKNKNFTDC